MMKEMGCDAIRTSHNMPSQMQMDICDSLGMMVMAESFDMWRYPKCKNGYARFFDDWWRLDIEHLILANRNHPSIIMWSIGNEIPEQGSAEGKDLSEQLQQACHSLDATRYVTQGLDHAEASIESGVAKIMDVPGFNYRVHKYDKNIKQLPQGFLLGSETASTVSSRGVYKFPVVPDDNSRFASWAPGYDPKALEKGGQATTIWVNLHLMMNTGPHAAVISASAIWQDCQRTVTICIGVIGIRMHTPSISCPTGVGEPQRKTRETVLERSRQSIAIPTIPLANSL